MHVTGHCIYCRSALVLGLGLGLGEIISHETDVFGRPPPNWWGHKALVLGDDGLNSGGILKSGDVVKGGCGRTRQSKILWENKGHNDPESPFHAIFYRHFLFLFYVLSIPFTMSLVYVAFRRAIILLYHVVFGTARFVFTAIVIVAHPYCETFLSFEAREFIEIIVFEHLFLGYICFDLPSVFFIGLGGDALFAIIWFNGFLSMRNSCLVPTYCALHVNMFYYSLCTIFSAFAFYLTIILKCLYVV